MIIPVRSQIGYLLFIGMITSSIIWVSCHKEDDPLLLIDTDSIAVENMEESIRHPQYLYELTLSQDICMGDYFDFIDSMVLAYDSLVPYLLTEHLLVRANPWLIDSLAETDYYLQMAKGQFIYDQKEMTILKSGTLLRIPTLTMASKIMRSQANTTIDINIPEFRLRILENELPLFTFPIRVGQNKSRYLATANREVDLRTQTGEGYIYSIKRDPSFINPVDGKRFTHTRRDDKKVTWMPMIPWINPEIDGHRYGQMIHPTTNPASLGKAYSNGCIGTKEADAWYIYYYAPVGTHIVIRYDLEKVTASGDTLRWKDIYP